MIFLMLIMGFVNLGVGAVMAMQLGFGPPGFAALWESLGPMPQADEVAEMPLELPLGTSAALDAPHSEMEPSEKAAGFTAAEVSAANDVVAVPDTVAVYNSVATAEATPIAPAIPAVAGDDIDAGAAATVDDDADLANNPILEQSVLDEVRSLGDSMADPLGRSGDTAVPSGK